MEPTQVLPILIRFRGVYILVYKNKFEAPSKAVKGLAPTYNITRPREPVTVANPTACSGLNIKYKS